VPRLLQGREEREKRRRGIKISVREGLKEEEEGEGGWQLGRGLT
jgi:hypothetical protein